MPSPNGMSVKPEAEDFGIYAGVPFLYHLSERLNRAIWWTMANPVMAMLWDLAFGVLLIALVSDEVRRATSSRVLSAFVIALLGLAFVAAGWLISERGNRILERAMVGPRLFGRLGGPPLALTRALARASRKLHIEFSPQDEQSVKTLIDLDLKYLELVTERRFNELQSVGTQASQQDLTSKWREIWDEKLMKISIEGMTLSEIFATGAFSQILPRITSALSLFGVVYKIYVGIVLFLAYQALHDHTRLLLVLQVSLVLSLLISACLYLNYSALFDKMPIRWVAKERPEALAPVIDSLENKVLRPRTLHHDDGYITALRGAFARALGVQLGWFAFLTLLLVALALAVGLVALANSRAHLISWYLSLGI